MTDRDKERFLSRIRKSESGCWLWTGHRYPNGYGQFYLSGKMVLSHRVSYRMHKGEISRGLCVCHTCDTPNCVNPDHLWIGTRKDNMMDMVWKGRAATGDRNGSRLHPERLSTGDRHGSRTHPECLARGDKHGLRLHPERVARGVNQPRAKLNDEKVVEIRKQWASGLSQSTIAKNFGVAQSLISFVVLRKIWKHVA